MSIGYADGLSRSLSNQNLEVIVRHQKAPIIGRICMDQCMIDVTDIEDVQEGDEVILIGRDHNLEVTVDEISRKSGTINNETLCAIASRVPRLKKKDALWQE
jgi:alanine racemase